MEKFQLYKIQEDWKEENDLAASQPDKLAEMNRWYRLAMLDLPVARFSFGDAELSADGRQLLGLEPFDGLADPTGEEQRGYRRGPILPGFERLG